MSVMKLSIAVAMAAIAAPLVAGPAIEFALSAIAATAADASFAPAMAVAQKDLAEYLTMRPSEKWDLPEMFGAASESSQSNQSAWPGDLASFYNRKRILVVGGSKGIGRGVALQAAAMGAGAVHIVGSSDAGQTTAKSMRAETPYHQTHSDEQLQADFRFFRANLFTLEGCQKLAEDLAAANQAVADSSKDSRYDLVVFTIGQWPDMNSGKPLTPAGYEKGVFLAIIARLAVFNHLAARDMLATNSVIMYVLASSMDTPPAFILPGMSDAFFTTDFVPSMLKPQSEEYRPQLMPVLATEMTVADVTLMKLAEMHPDKYFIGTYPGLIATGIGSTALGERVMQAAFFVARLLGITISERRCGIHHLAIVHGLVTGMGGASGDGSRQASFWDHKLVARHPPRVALGTEGNAFQDNVFRLLSAIVEI
eukprot:TRINITY_DN59590_c0_g1_i1.p1 TRINITY_DN59590_c0_g1~~TRINITY_DN59590_c0_g1_i1.p1  ORF type:complete len:424 (-),score=62.76 TRINITY_DN59590_c0_g1_i1:199-1470(-)